MMPRIPRRASLFAVFASFLASGAAAQSPLDTRPLPAREVVLDGVFQEWDAPRAADARTPHGATGTEEPDGSYPRLRQVRVRHDADAVYLLLDLDREVVVQDLAGSLVLMMDADGDPASGWSEHGMPGVDAVLEFSPLWPDGSRFGTAMRVRSAGRAAPDSVSATSAGVIAAPSHASERFELRIGRGGPVPFGARMTARLLSLDAAGAVADSLPAFTVDLADPAPRPVTRGGGDADPLTRPAAAEFRIVSWNVGRQTLFEQPEGFGVILRALSPDLLMLDEVAGGRSAEEVEALLNRIVPGDRPWRAVYGPSGGSQRGVIAARGSAPVLVAPFDREIPYPDSTRAILGADTTRGARAWLRNRLESHVAATGAIVEIGGRRLLLVTMDLESGGSPADAKDRLRRIEALEIRRAAAAARDAGDVDGVLVAGDLNLVSRTDPLALLAEGLDAGGRSLRTAQPLRLDDATAATWENPREPFTPSRLDYVLYGRSALEVVNGFVFWSGDLSAAWRARHGVAEDASSVTDHLPIVTDLRWAPDCP